MMREVLSRLLKAGLLVVAVFSSMAALGQTERLGGAGPVAERFTDLNLPPANIEDVFKAYSKLEPVNQVLLARKVSIYRQYQPTYGDHSIALTIADGTSQGYINEATYKLFADASVAGAIPLYRCASMARVQPVGDRYVSEFKDCQGELFEGQLGYAAKTQLPGTSPLYLCFNGGEYFVTPNGGECEPSYAGYSVVRILGYIPQ